MKIAEAIHNFRRGFHEQYGFQPKICITVDHKTFEAMMNDAAQSNIIHGYSSIADNRHMFYGIQVETKHEDEFK